MRHIPHRFMYLNTWTPFVYSVHETLGGVAIHNEANQSCGLGFQSLGPLLVVSLCFVLVTEI